jgi:hypothetical protein
MGAMIAALPPACTVTYSVEAPSFQRTIPRALKAVTAATGIRFQQVPAGGDIHYEQSNIVIEGATTTLGMFDPASHTVYLGIIPGMSLLSLTLHETLHAVGAGHVPEDGYLMSASFSGSTTITGHDVEGLSCG